MKALIASALLATAAVFFYLGTQTAAPVVVAPAPVAATPIVDPFKAPAEPIQWNEYKPVSSAEGCYAGQIVGPGGFCVSVPREPSKLELDYDRIQQNKDLARAIADEQERRDRTRL